MSHRFPRAPFSFSLDREGCDRCRYSSVRTFLRVFGVYSLALWIFGSIRTGLTAFYLLIAAALVHLAVSVCNVALV
jgi:hypothetical protein